LVYNKKLMNQKKNQGEYQNYCDFCEPVELGKKYGQLKNYQILECQKCGLIWVNPLEYFYFKNKDDKYWAEDIYLANQKKQEKRFQDQLKIFLEKTKIKNHSILEVGSGLGFFLNVCHQFNLQVEGCDISQKATELSLANGNKSRQGSLDNYYLDKSYQAIFAFNLIEHLAHPKEFFQQAKRILKNDGYLVLETPIKESLFYRLAEFVFFIFRGRLNYLGINPNGHIYQFSLKTLKEISQQFNFKIIYQKRFNPPFEEIFGKSALFDVKMKFLFRLLCG